MTTRPLPPAPEPLPRPVTDAHTHLLSTQEFSGLAVADALAAARAVNVTRLVEVGVDVASSRAAVALSETHPEVVANIAIHPNDAARLGVNLAGALAELEPLAAHPGVRGIGETGLDYFRTTDAAGRALQRESFTWHIRLAQRTGATLVIHDRDAHDDVLAVLDEAGVPERVVMHCFSGDAAFAAECVARGAWLSFPGTLTFKPNEALREAARAVPADRLLVETDAPYLTPMPFRGKPNSSYLLPLTVAFLAGVRGLGLGDCCDLVNDNAAAAFGGGWGA
ncbi:TatD family hydrolase [Propionicicella superfundia]|uniref:TatD family hydrolase n=1 Tax=Propionicicella superfundia TaxID=348582 RepID=UPI00040C5480|nr:TatD family hydrolase [Propionicicella superfundia]